MYCFHDSQCMSLNCGSVNVDNGDTIGQCANDKGEVNGPGCLCLRDADCRSGSCEWSSTGRYCAGSDKHSDKDTIE